ncbi:uncharacterized protein BO96DRAFT_473592, partial [Aspergillus niger CBS 101883]|uniref:uncharacterized protein n=1 Tax=Aspergillus lacticoffeatus (strain CBS 101883) TaxID=1450533 RepID=UPI000D7FAAE9
MGCLPATSGAAGDRSWGGEPTELTLLKATRRGRSRRRSEGRHATGEWGSLALRALLRSLCRRTELALEEASEALRGCRTGGTRGSTRRGRLDGATELTLAEATEVTEWDGGRGAGGRGPSGGGLGGTGELMLLEAGSGEGGGSSGGSGGRSGVEGTTEAAEAIELTSTESFRETGGGGAERTGGTSGGAGRLGATELALLVGLGGHRGRSAGHRAGRRRRREGRFLRSGSHRARGSGRRAVEERRRGQGSDAADEAGQDSSGKLH